MFVFTVYTHATLISTRDGIVNTTPVGLDSTFEITMVLSFTESVTGVQATPNGTTAFFKIDTAAPMFFQMFYDASPDRNDLQGSGFGDGRLIANGTAVGASTGDFTVSSFTPVPFDGYIADDYVDIDSVTGSGAQTLVEISKFTLDETFFLTALDKFVFNFGNISINTPFAQGILLNVLQALSMPAQ